MSRIGAALTWPYGRSPADDVQHLRGDAATVRPGGRTARVREAVIDATIAELTEVGYAALRVDAVAERAGVNKTTVYRRWGNKAAWCPPPSSSAAAAGAARRHRHPARGSHRAAQGDPARPRRPLGRRAAPRSRPARRRQRRPVRAPRQVLAARFKVSGVIFERAVERGELPADTDPGFLLEMISGPLYFHWLMLGHPLDDDFLERMADFMLHGARARPPESEAPSPRTSRSRPLST
ncbi:TetR/AcrR family transcriptional regulator [Nonomuraea thailandensis]